MTLELAFASIRQGELTASDAWKILSPLVDTKDPKMAGCVCDALRVWAWRSLDRRRRDPELREWIDILNRIEAFFVERFVGAAAKIEMLAELLHESLGAAELVSAEDLLRRKHVAPILRLLGQHEGEWVERAELMTALGLKAANTTRLVSLLVDVGWVEQVTTGREAAYRISVEGLVQVKPLPDQAFLRENLVFKGVESTFESWFSNLSLDRNILVPKIFPANEGLLGVDPGDDWHQLGAERTFGVESKPYAEEDDITVDVPSFKRALVAR